MLNILIYDMPETVTVDGMELEIYTDFRDYIELSEVLESGSDEQALLYILGLYKDLPPNLDGGDLVNEVTRFYKMDESEEEQAETGKGGKARPVFSFSDDMPYILGDFRRYYSIDLIHVNYLHWFEFNALLEGLPDDSGTKKRIGYRSIEVNKIKDKTERKRIREIQNRLRIRRRKTSYLSDSEIGAMFS